MEEETEGKSNNFTNSETENWENYISESSLDSDFNNNRIPHLI